MTRRPAPQRRPQPAPPTFRECDCGGRMYACTSPGSRGRTLTYYRCEECGRPDYSTLGVEVPA